MDKDKLANAIVKAIAYQENGGKPNIDNPSKGKSGEMKSIFQFEPATWKQDSSRLWITSQLRVVCPPIRKAISVSQELTGRERATRMCSSLPL